MNETQEKHFGDEPFPRKPLFGALALVALALILVTTARVTKVGTPEKASETAAAVVAERDLRFEDQSDGGIAVYDDRDGRLVDTVTPGSNNFIRGALRSLVRERRSDGIAGKAPFRLTARRDGHLLLSDPATGRTIDLGSFGPTNASAFAKFLVSNDAGPTRTASVVQAK